MSKPPQQPDRPRPGRGRYQYSLGALFLLTLVVSVASSVGAELARAKGNRVVEYFLLVAAAPLLLLMGMGVFVYLRDLRIGKGRRKSEKDENEDGDR